MSKRAFTVVLINDDTGHGRSFIVNVDLDPESNNAQLIQNKAHTNLNRAFHQVIGGLLDELSK